MRRFFGLWLFAGLFFAVQPALGCGADLDCEIGERSYRIHLPAVAAAGQPLGAIVFAHGYRGSAAGVMKNRSLRQLADDLGVALIALDALGNDWHIDGVPNHSRKGQIDEFAYVGAVLEDSAARFGLDPNRLMATGFSAGGMLVWNLACHMSGHFQGFAPIAGTFWRPVPSECPTPATSLIHIHGTDDPIVPLEGRPIADTHQGNVFEALEMYQSHGRFEASGDLTSDDLDCDLHRNDAGKMLDFCLFKGGHSFRTAFVRFAWMRLIDGE